jgi:DNA recombination protein RmuC
MREAQAEALGEQAFQAAQQRFRRDMEVHIRDISEKYLIAGETQDTAFLFVPSESIFAEIHETLEAIVQRAHRARVVIVSPSLLMLSIQVIQAILKDARMREQAHLIQGEVVRLMEDLSRLDDRTRKLQAHFSMAQKDVDLILTSSDKLTKRGSRIEALEFAQLKNDAEQTDSPQTEQQAPPTPDPAPKFEPRSSTLKLRVVDEDD